MTWSAREVMTRFFEAESQYIAAGGPLGGASFDEMAPLLAEDVVMHQAESLPYAGSWRGRTGIESFFAEMARTWERLDIVDVTYFDGVDDPNSIVVSLRMVAKHRSGRVYDAPMLQVVTVAHGAIQEWRPFYWDTALVRNVCGLPPA